ncbi:ABC transporter ATP-binding protein [Pinisolibacter sp.]|uniref:ABC transporter ATP-binding protein n=1 Tax=Pinisolibacter sp. TaxID=2172024 RepID=UPI002FDEEAF8
MILSLSGLTVGYDSNPVLTGIDLDVAQGEIVTLVGANGAGKSTMVRTIAGLMRPTAGDVVYEGRSIVRSSPAERLRLGLALVPEGRQVFAGLTVRENLALGTHAVHGSIDAAERRRRLDEVLDLFPVLAQRLDSPAGNFSGGQQQMLAIGRGLMSGPRLLMLDEPSLGLSPLLVSEIFRLICSLRDRGLSILLAEQNARSALAVADRGYVLENGRVALSGSAADLLGSSEIAERYLGAGAAVAGSSAAERATTERLRQLL